MYYFDLKNYLALLSILSILFGILVFVFPAILNYLVGSFFIVSGLTGLLSLISRP